ncbi:MAG: large-conductance mechanosensitive channel protein MscL [Akkermansiaceae bacterium]|nr:large-conductance mechanosensitive channel protein MscL [Akkermansiaceae bacterium]
MNIKKLKPAWVDEFKAFALKGNVMDMAVGVIIGGAFGKIVSSLVEDIIMPLVSLLTGGSKDLSALVWQVSSAGDGIVVKYGNFCQTVLDFLIIALSIFFAIRLLCSLRAKAKEEQPAPAPEEPAPTPEEVLLLREIRDALKNKGE